MATVKHAHRWKIDPQHAEYSWGRCSGCKAERMFRNSIPDVVEMPGTARKKRLAAQRNARAKEKRVG